MIEGTTGDAGPAARRTRGFTLVEIMVVVVILGILAVLIVPRVVGRTDEARTVAAKQDVAAIMQALKLYRLDNGRYPSTEQGIAALVTKPQSDPVPANWQKYLDRVPKDPWETSTSTSIPACAARSMSSRSGPTPGPGAADRTPTSAPGTCKPCTPARAAPASR